GVRMALGAGSHEVQSLVMKEGLWLTGVGIIVGLGLTVLVAPVLQGMLLNVNSIDGVLYGLVTGLLVLIATLACFIPARRATKVDPMVSLRCE
ncbi:MAG: FtsX-like permease family protein, partial [Planctomycetota bacterium]|nr:FtsX-like permease family protein [Planctomycetota bacterium]